VDFPGFHGAPCGIITRCVVITRQNIALIE
jgi:hypothetical protein